MFLLVSRSNVRFGFEHPFFVSTPGNNIMYLIETDRDIPQGSLLRPSIFIYVNKFYLASKLKSALFAGALNIHEFIIVNFLCVLLKYKNKFIYF